MHEISQKEQLIALCYMSIPARRPLVRGSMRMAEQNKGLILALSVFILQWVVLELLKAPLTSSFPGDK